MSMISPSIIDLQKQVDCRYTLVVSVSKRARQILGGTQALIDTKELKSLAVAIEEVNRGLISYERPADIED